MTGAASYDARRLMSPPITSGVSYDERCVLSRALRPITGAVSNHRAMCGKWTGSVREMDGKCAGVM